MKRVNPFVSDLFFNHDLTHAANTPDVGGYDDDRLKTVAGEFLNMLRGVGPSAEVPTVSELIADFYNRL